MAILVIEDDLEICGLLGKVFEQAGIDADFAHRGDEGLEAALEGEHDLAVLDVMLPGLDGVEVLKRLRRQSELPVIMLTARGDDVDRIVGRELGADDYLPKPFVPRELVARIRAILRRSASPAQAEPDAAKQANGVRIEPAARSAWCDGRPLDLTTTEFDLLLLLVESAGRVLSHDYVLDRMAGRESTPFDRSIDMHISHLRKKLGAEPPRIRTVRGVGYQFVTPEEEPA